MGFDYKKEYKEFYLPHKKPGIVTAPSMNFLAVWGNGGPNEEGGAYKHTLGRPGFFVPLAGFTGSLYNNTTTKEQSSFLKVIISPPKGAQILKKGRGC